MTKQRKWPNRPKSTTKKPKRAIICQKVKKKKEKKITILSFSPTQLSNKTTTKCFTKIASSLYYD